MNNFIVATSFVLYIDQCKSKTLVILITTTKFQTISYLYDHVEVQRLVGHCFNKCPNPKT
jgi:hypothetical protein